MFVIASDFAVELKDICKISRYSSTEVSEAYSKYRDIVSNPSKYGSPEEAEDAANEAYNEYSLMCENNHWLEVNDKYIVRCASEDVMNSVYGKIIQALKMLRPFVEIDREDGIISNELLH